VNRAASALVREGTAFSVQSERALLHFREPAQHGWADPSLQ
jgi:hypothetical protein